MNLYIRGTMEEVIAKLKELAEKEKSLNITTDSDQANQRQYYLAFPQSYYITLLGKCKDKF